MSSARRRGGSAGRAGPGGRDLAVAVRSAGRRSLSSARWLARQLNDPYVTAAKAAGYRSRAAFKLAELDDRYRLIRKGARIVDLGAAPGGWTQVAAARAGAEGRVVALDLLPVEPIPGAVILQGDFMAEDAPARLAEALGGAQPDLVLSDMAPNTTGHTATDHLRIMGLAEAALDFACRVLAPGGAFVCKLFQGGAERGMLETLKRHFATVRHAKPPASRKDSRELYIVAQGFKA